MKRKVIMKRYKECYDNKKMVFSILKQLQNNTGSDYGDNLCKVPSRIIPSINSSENKDKSIEYILPYFGKESIICNIKSKLPEPSAYFRSPNTFLKSFLYLSNSSYYENISYPSNANQILNTYIRNIFEEHSKDNVPSNKKLVQIMMNNTSGIFDTDPDKNSFFSKFIKIILKKEKCEIIIIREKDGFFDTIPNKIPDIDVKNKDSKSVYILLLNQNGVYSPYGKSYISNKK